MKTKTTQTAQYIGANVRRLRERKFRNVEHASEYSFKKLSRGISVPRWYRLESGEHPGMVGFLLDDLAKIFRVTTSSLVKAPKGFNGTNTNKKKRSVCRN